MNEFDRFRSAFAAVRAGAAALLLAGLLAGCGSGGDSAPAPAPAPAVAPAITLAPGSQSATEGASVTFRVSAIGAPTRYQWRRDGADIAGATGSTYAQTVGLADNGARFSVVVGNSVGEVRSSEAILTVYPVPPRLATCPAVTDVAYALGPTTTPAKAGVDTGAVVGGCSGSLRSVQWTQTGGPAVALLSDKSPAIGFLPAAAGTYTFRADIVLANGAVDTRTVTIPVVDNNDAARIALRTDQSALQGANVSVRAWPTLPLNDSIVSIAWRQTAGPAVVLDTRDPLRALFTAPSVTVDTPLAFTATMRTGLGSLVSDEVLVVVEARAQAPSANEYVFADTALSRAYAYRQAGAYANVLQRCVYDPQLQWSGPGKNTCTLTTLPFLGQDTGGAEPTVAQIMDRVVVSHDWMGAVFEQFIGRADMADVRRLLNGVTAVVIGAHVRPSFYYALTGAIYLDADNFWLTPEQRDVIDETPDFRSDFDRDLAYSGVWRYALGSQNIFQFFPPDARQTRPADYLVFESAWLLYHELGHANDFLPPAVRVSLNPALTAWDNIGPRYGASLLPSDLLAQQLPLTSLVLRGLAQVKFTGIPADAAQRLYSPQQVGDLFRADRATDEYNYTTTREDIAMVFEEFMMFRNHGIRRDMAITDKIVPGTTSNTLIVRWGQRGRAGAASIKPRARLAVQNLAPWIDPAAVDAMPAPIDMRAGESWTANLAQPKGAGPVKIQDLSTPQARAADAWLLRRAQERR